MTDQATPVVVVIDTNVWRSQLLLRTSLGAAVLYAIQRTDSRIGLPEVIETEIRKNLVLAGTQAVDDLSAALEVIQRLTGEAPNVALPTEAELVAGVDARLEELGPLFERVPFTLDHARKALERVNLEIAPNGPKNQQFKDSAIWEAVLDLGAAALVLLITSDKGFYEGRDLKRGLAAVLQQEATDRGVVVVLYPDLAGAADHLREATPPLDQAAVAAAISEAIEGDVEPLVEAQGFELVRLAADPYLTAFATEDHQVLSVVFGLKYEIVDSAPEGELRNGSTAVTGSCAFVPSEGRVSEVLLDEVRTTWTNVDGSEGRSGNVFARAAFGGRGTVPLRIETPVE